MAQGVKCLTLSRLNARAVVMNLGQVQSFQVAADDLPEKSRCCSFEQVFQCIKSENALGSPKAE